jgi:hypothetical protein
MTHQLYLSPEAGIGASSCWATTDLTRPPSLIVTIRGFLTPTRSKCAAGGPTGGPAAHGHAGDAGDHRPQQTTIGNTNEEYRCRGRHAVGRSTGGPLLTVASAHAPKSDRKAPHCAPGAPTQRRALTPLNRGLLRHGEQLLFGNNQYGSCFRNVSAVPTLSGESPRTRECCVRGDRRVCAGGQGCADVGFGGGDPLALWVGQCSGRLHSDRRVPVRAGGCAAVVCGRPCGPPVQSP